MRVTRLSRQRDRIVLSVDDCEAIHVTPRAVARTASSTWLRSLDTMIGHCTGVHYLMALVFGVLAITEA